MRTALLIGWNDARLFLRGRTSWIWLFLMPLVFVYFMGMANRGPGGPSLPDAPVVIVQEDEGFLSDSLLREITHQGLHPVTNAAEASGIPRLLIPAGFTSNVLAGGSGKLTLKPPSGGADPAAALVEARLLRAAVVLNAHLLELAVSSTGAPATPEELKALQQRPTRVSLDSRHAGRKPLPTGFNLSLPGVLVMYLLMNLLTFGGAALAWERRHGVLRRIQVHPVTPRELIAGKIWGLVILGGLQVIILLLAGRLLFGVQLGDALGGVLLCLMVQAWVSASLGVLIGSLVRSEDRVVGIAVLTSLVMAALGGCWWPLEIVPDHVRTLAHVIPTGWAMDALHQLITYGSGLAGAWQEIAVLAGFGVAANLAAARGLRS